MLLTHGANGPDADLLRAPGPPDSGPDQSKLSVRLRLMRFHVLLSGPPGYPCVLLAASSGRHLSLFSIPIYLKSLKKAINFSGNIYFINQADIVKRVDKNFFSLNGYNLRQIALGRY